VTAPPGHSAGVVGEWWPLGPIVVRSRASSPSSCIVNSMDVGGLFRMVKRKEGSTIPYALRATKYEFFTDKDGYPCQQPPWGSLYAVDLNTGGIRWHSILGEFDELKQRGIPKTGTPNIGGSMVTDGGLVFIAATSDRKCASATWSWPA